jgi:hypothetical protein
VGTAEGWRDRAVVIDLFRRQMAGFAMRERMPLRWLIDGLRMAWFRRRPTNGLIFHSDRGRQTADGGRRRSRVTTIEFSGGIQQTMRTKLEDDFLILLYDAQRRGTLTAGKVKMPKKRKPL